ncbi:MAG: sel1 repeat family protein [Gammaproteobacteria bacterium]|nr:sel1 repeat family protein [Gammaproteobacteria bacterium]
MKKTILTLVLMTGILSFNALAQLNIHQGYQAYIKGDYLVALRHLQPLAKDGEPYAQYVLGVMYATGKGVRRNDEIAIKWYRKSADQGFDDAQYAMGKMYKNARVVKRDYSQAIKWFKKAEKQGHKPAKFAIIALCENRAWICQ